ncbi:MAG: ribonuclease H-like domain-containing protein [Nanobdellota archaeon]
MNEIIIDIETAPVDIENYFNLDEEEKLKKLNPIDSYIVAIGIMKGDEEILFNGDEKDILRDFWNFIEKNEGKKIVGFNIKKFDIPFITSRSFIKNVKVSPLQLSKVIDVREWINAYRYGQTRGKLKEFAKLIGIEVMDVEGSDIATLVKDDKFDVIESYLKKDLEITKNIYERAIDLNFDKITRW